jgi:hypothetical protein
VPRNTAQDEEIREYVDDVATFRQGIPPSNWRRGSVLRELLSSRPRGQELAGCRSS